MVELALFFCGMEKGDCHQVIRKMKKDMYLRSGLD